MGLLHNDKKGRNWDFFNGLNLNQMNIKRIVSLAPSNTEIIFALGEGGKLVGVTEFCNYPPEAGLVEKIGGFSTPNMEKIISLSPDLVLATEFHLKAVVPGLKKRGLAVSVVETKMILDIPEAIIFIGGLIGRKKKAYRLAQSIQDQIDTLEEQTRNIGVDERARVCYICSHNPLRIARKSCCVDKSIELAGGINIGSEIAGREVNLETIVNKNPDVILVSSGHGETVDLMDYVKNEKILHRTNAYRNNKVYKVRADLFSRFGPRAVCGVEEIFKIIHK